MLRNVIGSLCFLLLILPATAEADEPPEFKEAYQSYMKLMGQGKARDAIPYAEKALEIALNSDAFNDETRGKLAFNLAYAYLEDRRLSESVKTFTAALELLEKAGGNENLRAEALVYRGLCYQNLQRYDEARVDLEHALELLTGKERAVELVRADALELSAWVAIAQRRSGQAHEYATKAHEILAKLLTDRHPRTIRSLIAVSASLYLRRRPSEALDLLAQAIDLADKAGMADPGSAAKPGQFTEFEFIRFHERVATLYRLMDRTRDAKYHEDIASELWKGRRPRSMRVKPIERRPPRYPAKAARRGIMGWAIVEYTVRKDGTTADVRIVESAPEGYFEQATISAVEKWTYEPCMEDGKPVEVENMRTVIHFKLRR